jgi:hypothetical protein
MTDELMVDLAALEQSGARLPLTFTAIAAFDLLALLQVVVRLPGIQGTPIERFGRDLALEIGGHLARTPAIKEAIQRGWEFAFDEPGKSDGPAPAGKRKPRRPSPENKQYTPPENKGGPRRIG